MKSAKEPRTIGIPITAPIAVNVSAVTVAKRANPLASPNQSVRGRHFSSDILITSTRANWFVAPLKPEVSSDGQLALTLPLDIFAESRMPKVSSEGDTQETP